MNSKDLESIKTRLGKTTAWDYEVIQDLSVSDRDFIAHSKQDIESLLGEVERLQADNENLAWNLAGCDTYALGYGLEGEHAKELARPALNSVRKMAEESQRYRTALEKYGRHDGYCQYPAHDEHEDGCRHNCLLRSEGVKSCTCGFSDALLPREGKNDSE